MRAALLGLVLSSLLVAAPALAQTVLSGATIHVGNGEVIEGGVVVIGADGKIAAVGKNVAAPANAEVVDVTGKIVTPGLIDLETQLGLVEIHAVDRTRDADAGVVDPRPGGADPVRAAFRVTDAFNPSSPIIPIQRVGGVTSVVASPSGGLVSGQSAFVDLGAEQSFATVMEPFVALRVNLGNQAHGSRGTELLRLREVLDDAKFYAANRARFDENRARLLSASRLDLEVLAEAITDGKPVYFSVDRASDILAVLQLSREYGLRPVISGGAEAWKVAKELAADKVPVIVDPLENLPYSFDMLGARLDNAALLARAGVPVVLSTFDSHNVRNLRFMAGNAVRAGMEHGAALQAVTKNAAEAVGMGSTHGTLEAGKVGNVVVWTGDPFQPNTQPESIWIGGARVDTTNRQAELFERYRVLQRRGEPAKRQDDLEGGKEKATGGQNVESDD